VRFYTGVLFNVSPLKEDSAWQVDWPDLSSREGSDAHCSGCQ
jgi:hypothetical protein